MSFKFTLANPLLDHLAGFGSGGGDAWSTPGGGTGQTVLYSPDEPASALAGSGSGGASALGVTTVSNASTPFIINITWDSSVASAPAGFTAGVTSAVQYLESLFSDAVTINIAVGYGEVDGNALSSGNLGSSISNLTSLGYSTLRSDLSKDATSANDTAAVASLPTTAPVSGNFWTTTAQSKAIGLSSATGTSIDGYVGFSSTLPFSYSGSVASGSYDFNGVVLHEITEVMGRGLIVGGTVGASSSSYELMDLFHYSAAGVRDFSGSTPGYISSNGGTTSLGALNTDSGGDPGDLSSSVGNDSFDAFTNAGVTNPMTASDLQTMDIIGWNLASAASISSVSITPGALAAAQTSTGLVANAALASFTEVGGPSGDSYGYTLGGSGAASFKLTTSGNAASLTVGATAPAGAAAGKLYALSVTATDLTKSTSGSSVTATTALDVVVGTSANNSINVATLAGTSGTATPCFVFGAGGNDTINASGMSGRQWIVGGAGADTMSGGTGINVYLYGAVADSIPSAMDTISNFHVATDLIDLTGIGSKLTYAGKIAAKGTIPAGSIGWQTSGGNTLVYVNTSGAAEALTAANMEIKLTGALTPTTSNFAHL